MAQEITVTHVGGSSLAGQQQRFAQDRVRLGRRPDNDIAFDPHEDRAASGHHAEFYVENGAIYVKDCGSQNGTWVNGARIAGPVAISSGDTVRLGEQGPEMRVALAGAAATPPTMTDPQPLPKKAIGEQTLQRAISSATALERSRTSKRMLVILLVVVGAATIGTVFFLKGRDEQDALREDQAKIKQDVEETKKLADDLRSAAEASLKKALEGYEAELEKIKGEMGKGEAQVARLIVELQERDQMIEKVRQRQDLSEAQRQKLLKETQEKVNSLRNALRDAERTARENAGSGKTWADLASRYEQSIFLVVAQWPKQGRQGTGTAFCVDRRGILATNAHVSKMFDNAPVKVCVQNGSGKVFQVKRHKNHPRYRGVQSPDLGLIQLETRAPIYAMPIASQSDLRRLRIGTQLGTIGYPGELGAEYLRVVDRKRNIVRTAMATFKDGWVGRMTTYNLTTAHFNDRHFIQHSASVTQGTSGSPMFTSDGLVVAINNAGKTMETIVRDSKGRQKTKHVAHSAEISFAIRADELTDFLKRTGW